MNKINKVFLLIFIMSLFLVPNCVKADYKASVVGDKPICELFGAARGKCLYRDKNLNSVDTSWDPKGYYHWASLDLGDEVTVFENDTIPTNDTTKCSDYYVKVSAAPTDQPWALTYGYFCHADLKSDFLTDELKEEFRQAGFPESYWEKLAVLKTNHPKWTFYAIDTELNFNDVVLNETYGARSLLRLSVSNNYSLLSNATDSFDYINNKYIPYDDVTGSNPWVLANYDTIAFYMDPRNFLTDMYVLQFQGLKNNNKLTDENLINILSSAYGLSYNQRYIQAFIDAGKQSGVDSIYLAALSIEEVGREQTTATLGTYNGHYNFYNIGATGGADPVYRGLDFAAGNEEATMRPWNTPERAIIGGAKWIYNQYLDHGQDTSYFKKFNVIEIPFEKNNPGKSAFYNYTHQYMANIQAPANEADTSYSAYFKNNLLDLELNFYIPVYRNMPEKTNLPTKQGWPNNYLKNITINGTGIAGFKSEAENYNYYLDINNPVITIDAQPISNLASVNGKGKYTIDKNKTINIDCIAQNGDLKTYKINIILTGELKPNAVDIKTTLNSTDIKNNDKYLYGFEPGTNIESFSQKIKNVKSDAIIIISDYNGEQKKVINNDIPILATSDKVTIQIGNEVKTFEIIIYGDMTGEGEINNLDFIYLKKHLLEEKKLSNVYLEAANVFQKKDEEFSVDNIDFITLKKYLLGDKTVIKQIK